MEIIAKFVMVSQWLGFPIPQYILKWGRLKSDQVGDSEAVLAWTWAEARTLSEMNEGSWKSEKD